MHLLKKLLLPIIILAGAAAPVTTDCLQPKSLQQQCLDKALPSLITKSPEKLATLNLPLYAWQKLLLAKLATNPLIQNEFLAQCNDAKSFCTIKTQEGMRIIASSRELINRPQKFIIRIWDMNGNLVTKCYGHTGPITSICTVETPEGIRIISGSADCSIRIWNMNGKELARCTGHTDTINSVCIIKSDDNAHDIRIISCSGDTTISIWNINGKKLARCTGHISAVTSLCVTQTTEGIRIISGSRNGTVRICDINGNQLAQCRGHTDYVTSVCVAQTPEDIRIISGSCDGTVRIWNMNGRELTRFNEYTGREHSAICTVQTPKGTHIIIAGVRDNTICILDMNGNELTRCRGHQNSTKSVCSVQTSAGIHLISGSWDGTIRIWDMNGRELAQCEDHKNWDMVYVCAIQTPEGIRIISRDDRNNTIRIWNILDILNKIGDVKTYEQALAIYTILHYEQNTQQRYEKITSILAASCEQTEAICALIKIENQWPTLSKNITAILESQKKAQAICVLAKAEMLFKNYIDKILAAHDGTQIQLALDDAKMAKLFEKLPIILHPTANRIPQRFKILPLTGAAMSCHAALFGHFSFTKK